ncbi:ATP-dependent DNA helicase DDM1 [Cucurbita maxima]|uniref:ATP-dependent DNA helicase DDM1 n=1 Tax=Cucurbita maxima TaxID=3661 RepID=A0A6J1JAC1_CUCMA|nr:ATP-dependent DNA helicase DDM1 [Cucurbita maxima]XP_022985071.1 ATP-dependent DNA helicase DDM1 [Cucurbita maxima]
MALEEKPRADNSAESPTSVLEDEDICNGENEIKLEEKIILEAKNGDSSLISKEMAEEEQKLLEARVKDEETEKLEDSKESAKLNDNQFTKLDELLTQTQLYSEFLLEKMDDITFNGVEEENKSVEKSNVRGSKRKAAPRYNNRKAKRAVAAMLTRSKEGEHGEDENLTEEERIEKEQSELVPLLTGGKLKSYQLKGVKWLISLWQNGLNGILADQMGLGKTIQTIGFLAHLKGKGLDGPYLVIAPLSTLSNWINEILRFVPTVSAIIYHGNKKQREEIRRKSMPKTIGPNFPIVVTSYEIAMSDAKKVLRHYNWKYLVVDEGHRLKNSKCKLLKELKYITVENKLLLTGTPLQNNLAELWSLLNFILPDIFSSNEEFESWFDLSGKSHAEEQEETQENRKAQVVAKLHAILRPFLLRRMKSDVELMLPRKKEIILYATMTECQKNFQEHLINKTLESHLSEKGSGHVLKGKLNNLMVQLRKNCNHPDLLESVFDESYTYPPVEQIVEQCGKFRLLDRLLTRLLARKHKVLIFSQWTKILDIMDYYFSEKGFEVCRIDGNVKLDERKRQIQEFNDVNSNYRIFILSTRAGGLGINLTAADTCILYDSDWNPQMDLQAMDRCHRIGQTKPVHVYRLATAQSVEGRILNRAFSKLKLEHVVIEKGQFHQERTKPNSGAIIEEEDLLALLRKEDSAEDKMIQTDISDADLERILDRSDLLPPSGSDDEKLKVSGDLYPLKGPGWEVVIPTSTGGVLSTLNA